MTNLEGDEDIQDEKNDSTVNDTIADVFRQSSGRDGDGKGCIQVRLRDDHFLALVPAAGFQFPSNSHPTLTGCGKKSNTFKSTVPALFFNLCYIQSHFLFVIF